MNRTPNRPPDEYDSYALRHMSFIHSLSHVLKERGDFFSSEMTRLFECAQHRTVRKSGSKLLASMVFIQSTPKKTIFEPRNLCLHQSTQKRTK